MKLILKEVKNYNNQYCQLQCQPHPCSCQPYCALPWPYFPLQSDQPYILISDSPLQKETFRDYLNGRREIFFLEVLGFKNVTFCWFNYSLCCFVLGCFFFFSWEPLPRDHMKEARIRPCPSPALKTLIVYSPTILKQQRQEHRSFPPPRGSHATPSSWRCPIQLGAVLNSKQGSCAGI